MCRHRVHDQAGENLQINAWHNPFHTLQGTLDALRTAMQNTRIMCAVMLDTKGPEIRTGFLNDPDTPLTFTAGKTIKITTDYDHKGDNEMISMRCLPAVALLRRMIGRTVEQAMMHLKNRI